MKQKIRRLARQMQRGDGDTFAHITYMPFLFGVLLLGIFFAMIGFWRMGVSYANDRGAVVGTTAASGVSAGTAAQNKAFVDWSNASSAPNGAMAVDSCGRSAKTTYSNTPSHFQYGYATNAFGPFGSVSAGQAQEDRRWERFYPGAPKAGCAD